MNILSIEYFNFSSGMQIYRIDKLTYLLSKFELSLKKRLNHLFSVYVTKIILQSN